MNDTPRLSLIWMLIGSTLLGVIGWQAELAAANRGVFVPHPNLSKPPPRTRSPSRASQGASVPFSIDPVKAYLDRAKRGMSAREIRWIASDFQRAGLDRPPGDGSEQDYRALRARQQLWYLDALADGLSLDPAQRDAAKAKLFELLDRDCAAFRERIDAAPSTTDGNMKFLTLDDVARFADASRWLCDDAFAPWNLCKLTKEQRALTMYAWVVDSSGEAGAAFVRSRNGWLNPEVPTVQDPNSGNRTEVESNGPEHSSSRLIMGDLFPLTPQQAAKTPYDDLQGQVRVCHPAQWKAALLMHPELAGKLMNLPEDNNE